MYSASMNRLILGAPGSGKSYVAEYAKTKGWAAFDADYDIPRLARWSDLEGRTVSFPEQPTVEWLEKHRFTWDKQVLQEFLSAHQDVWIFGIAENAFEQADLFDACFYLLVPEAVLRERLLSAGRTNARGKTEAEVQQIWRDIQTVHLPDVQKRHIQIIDARLNPDAVLQLISKA